MQTLFSTFIEGNARERRLHQRGLEQLYNKNQTMVRVRNEFLESNFDDRLHKAGIDEEFGLDLLVQMALHKRCNLPTLAGILRHHFEPAIDASQKACDMLHKAALADFVHWDIKAQMFVVAYNITEDVQRDLDRFQYPLPMVIEPRKVESNRDTGYLTARNSLILRKNHHENDICLDHINRVNRVKFCINHDTARMIKNQWRNLDRPKQGETNLDYKKRVKAFEKYDRTAKEVIDLLLAHGNEFYLTHKYDKRGRIYCQGYHVNYQGAPWNKAVIELADKEYVE
jgi:hypothetical protein